VTSASPSFWHDAKRWLPGVIISIIALVMVFRMASWENVAQVWRSVNLGLLLLAVLLTVISLVTRAIAWRILLGYRISVKNTFFAINIGYLLNNLFPLRLGEFGRSLLVGKDTGLGMVHVLSTVVIERALDLAFASILLLSTVSRVVDTEWIKPMAYTAIAAVTAGLIILFLMARFQTRVKAIVLNISSKSPFIRKYIFPQIDRLLDGFQVLGKPLELLKVFFWIGLSWLIWITLFYVMLVSVVPEAKFWWAVFADSLLALGVAVPSAPSGLGVYEAVLSWGLIQLGAGKDPAIAYAILMHVVGFSITSILGLTGLAFMGKSVMGLFNEVRKQPITQTISE
jgi:uncharacterized protein (TIRG00374 family)